MDGDEKIIQAVVRWMIQTTGPRETKNQKIKIRMSLVAKNLSVPVRF